MEPERRLVIVSNRLPVKLAQHGDAWTVQPGSGGLVTAMAPVLRNRGGLWMGWPGLPPADGLDLTKLLESGSAAAGYLLKPVWLTQQDIDGFYHGFANRVLWPLFHDLTTMCEFDPTYWASYIEVSRKFATALGDEVQPRDFIWINDYHLIHVGQFLRERHPGASIAFFLHIPFPSIDIFLRLPWRAQILNAILSYDLAGFQTPRDCRNFLACVQAVIPSARVHGRGSVVRLTLPHRTLRVGAFPIGIDAKAFAKTAAGPVVQKRRTELARLAADQVVVLGVDRLDYSKGLPERLLAFEELLVRYPELRGRITLIQLVVPSREEVPEYRALRERIERLTGAVNGRFSRVGWTPIRYFYRTVSHTELISLYRLAQIGLVTPLKDGMNLVAKEYCACQMDNDGVLILSEFAGAAAQLHHEALMVNPHDVTGIAQALHTAFHMPPNERQTRMKCLRHKIRKRDVFWWVDEFLRAAVEKSLRDFPPREEYMPQFAPADSDDVPLPFDPATPLAIGV